MLIFLTIFETPILIPDMTMLQYSSLSFRLGFFFSPRGFAPLNKPRTAPAAPRLGTGCAGTVQAQLQHHRAVFSSRAAWGWASSPSLITAHLVMSHLSSCSWTPRSLLRDRALKRSPSKGRISMCTPIKAFVPKHRRGQHGHRKIRTTSYPAHILFSCLYWLVVWWSSSGWHGGNGARSPCQLLVRHLKRRPYFGRSLISNGNYIPPLMGSCFSKPKLLDCPTCHRHNQPIRCHLYVKCGSRQMVARAVSPAFLPLWNTDIGKS